MSTFSIFQESDFKQVYTYEEILLDLDTEPALEQMKKLAATYDLHQLTVDDCVHQNQRSKFESYKNYLFIVWHYFYEGAESPIELHFVIGRNFLLIVSTGVPPKYATWKQLFFSKAEVMPEFVKAILQIFDVCVDHAENYLDTLATSALRLETEILGFRVQPADILEIKRRTLQFDRSSSTALSIVSHVMEHLQIGIEEKFHFRNINDHLTRIQDTVSQLRFQLVSLLDVYWGATSARTNQHMKRLTTMATLFVPFSLWSGFFGMNFEYMPFKETWFFYFAMSLMLLNFFGVVLFMIASGMLHLRKINLPKPGWQPHRRHGLRRHGRGSHLPAPKATP